MHFYDCIMGIVTDKKLTILTGNVAVCNKFIINDHGTNLILESTLIRLVNGQYKLKCVTLWSLLHCLIQFDTFVCIIRLPRDVDAMAHTVGK
jgi:hypothetical protein